MRSNINQHFIQKALPQAKWVWDRLLGTPGFWSILSSVIMATVASCDPKTSEITAPAPHQTRQLVPEISACGKMYPEKHMENVCQAHGCYHSFHHWKGVMLDNISKLTSWINSPQCSFVYIGNNMETTYFQHRPSNLFQMFPKKTAVRGEGFRGCRLGCGILHAKARYAIFWFEIHGINDWEILGMVSFGVVQ